MIYGEVAVHSVEEASTVSVAVEAGMVFVLPRIENEPVPGAASRGEVDVMPKSSDCAPARPGASATLIDADVVPNGSTFGKLMDVPAGKVTPAVDVETVPVRLPHEPLPMVLRVMVTLPTSPLSRTPSPSQFATLSFSDALLKTTSVGVVKSSVVGLLSCVKRSGMDAPTPAPRLAKACQNSV